jgi:hypothetical protein
VISSKASDAFRNGRNSPRPTGGNGSERASLNLPLSTGRFWRQTQSPVRLMPPQPRAAKEVGIQSNNVGGADLFRLPLEKVSVSYNNTLLLHSEPNFDKPLHQCAEGDILPDCSLFSG